MEIQEKEEYQMVSEINTLCDHLLETQVKKHCIDIASKLKLKCGFSLFIEWWWNYERGQDLDSKFILKGQIK